MSPKPRIGKGSAAAVRSALAIINPVAGRGRADSRWRELRPLALAAVDTVFDHRTGGPGDAARRAAEWSRSPGSGPIIVVGGDGTVHEVVNGLHSADRMVPIAVLPAGTGNDFVRNVGATSSPRELIAGLDRPGRCCDLGRLTFDGQREAGRTVVFVNSASVGVSAAANRYARGLKRILRGRFRYAVAGAWALLAGPRPRIILTEADGEELRGPLNLTFANGASFGGGMRIAPAAAPDDGWLDRIVIEPMGVARALLALSRLYNGSHLRLAGVRGDRANLPAILGTGNGALDIEADGQNFRAFGAVRVSLLPGVLPVIGA